MISIITAAMREEKTIGKGLETILNGFKGDFEVRVSIPDNPTFDALMKKANEMGIQDKIFRSKVSMDGKPKGKPFELNALMDEAKGDIWVFADLGDTYFDVNAINLLLKHFDNPKVTAVTGRPKSADSKNTMMRYFGNLLSDAAHHKRSIDLVDEPHGNSLKFIKKRKFFPVTGYLFASRRFDFRLPKDCLADDAYLSYLIYNGGGRIVYEPEAIVYVQYADTLKDYFKQKKRSTGGYIQLWEYGIVSIDTKSRSFYRELEYFWFPFIYAKNIRELIWSLFLFPIRLWLWIQIYWERKIIKKDFVKTWVRVESTKR